MIVLRTVWHVEYCSLSSSNFWEKKVHVCDSFDTAEGFANELRERPPEYYQCICVTGPHQHRVPA